MRWEVRMGGKVSGLGVGGCLASQVVRGVVVHRRRWRRGGEGEANPRVANSARNARTHTHTHTHNPHQGTALTRTSTIPIPSSMAPATSSTRAARERRLHPGIDSTGTTSSDS